MVNKDKELVCEEWYFDIQGMVFREVLMVEGVDIICIYINDLYQVVDVFGIEVVCLVFMVELM